MAKGKKKENTLFDILPLANRTGKLIFGYDRSLRSLYKKQPKLIILTNNFPSDKRILIEHLAKLNKIPVLDFKGTNNGLSEASSMHFRVGIISVVDEGKSELLGYAQKLSAF